MIFENSLTIGNGVYTIPEVAKILRLPYHKVNLWVNNYWDGELGKAFKGKYSWSVNKSKAISFHTLVEFYILILFAEAGVKTRDVLNAHIELTKKFNTAFPFAQKEILKKIHTDGKKIFLELNGDTISLDGTEQLNLGFIKQFFKNLDFDDDSIASRFWPLGRKKNIIVDPKKQFGHPTIKDTSIYPETLYNLHKAGEPISFIAFTYEIDEKSVKDAIDYCNAA
ncbi:DUF433 domain-containing protein [Leptobacterium sp. I13]|uniref:DUF433 domain-containing protein n=1 Tax=Leptobacterium meishanense TaxID=3128904 RepID=UPI0030ECF5B6